MNDLNMKTSKKGRAEMIWHEAICLTPYYDSKKVKTVGIGFTSAVIRDLDNWAWDKQISLERVITLYNSALPNYERIVNRLVKVKISQHMFDALVSLVYNIGGRGFANSTILKKINEQAPDKELVRALMMWNKIRIRGRLVVSKGLTKRRKMEASLLTKGIYQNKDMRANVIPISKTTHTPIYSKAYQISIKDIV